MTTLNQNITKFDRGYRWLHWVMAVLVLLMFFALVGFASVTTPEEHMTMLTGHSSMGTLITLLLLVRIFKRFIKKDPIPEPPISDLQKIAARTVQYALYALLILVPLTGFLTARGHAIPVNWFGAVNLSTVSHTGEYAESFELLRSIHVLGIRSLMVLLVLHIGAALFHGIVKKDGVLSSMLPGKKS